MVGVIAYIIRSQLLISENKSLLKKGASYRRGRDSMGRYTSRMEQPDPMGGEYGYPFPMNSGRYGGPRW